MGGKIGCMKLRLWKIVEVWGFVRKQNMAVEGESYGIGKKR